MDASFIDDLVSVLKKLLQAHERECTARRNTLVLGWTDNAAVGAAAAVTEAALLELAITLDDRLAAQITEHIGRLAPTRNATPVTLSSN